MLTTQIQFHASPQIPSSRPQARQAKMPLSSLLTSLSSPPPPPTVRRTYWPATTDHCSPTPPKPTRYEGWVIYIRYAYEKKGLVRRPCEPAYKIHTEIAARLFQIASNIHLSSAGRMPRRRTAQTRSHQITMGRVKPRMAGQDTPARRKKRPAKTSVFHLPAAPQFVRNATLNRLSGLSVPVFVRKRSVLSFLARGEYGRKWGAVPTSREISFRALGHSFAARTLFETP